MSERPNSNVSPLLGRDQDVADAENLVERLLVTTVDAEATWSLVRQRIGFDRNVAPIRARRRPRRVLVLAIAAALMLGGAAFAAVTQRAQPGQPATPGVQVPRGAPGTTAGQETGRERLTPTPTPEADPRSPTPTPPSSPDPGTGSGTNGTAGSGDQPGQDQQGGGDQQPSDGSSGQDQQDQSGSTDGSGTQSDPSPSTGGDQEASPSPQATTDQQS